MRFIENRDSVLKCLLKLQDYAQSYFPMIYTELERLSVKLYPNGE